MQEQVQPQIFACMNVELRWGSQCQLPMKAFEATFTVLLLWGLAPLTLMPLLNCSPPYHSLTSPLDLCLVFLLPATACLICESQGRAWQPPSVNSERGKFKQGGIAFKAHHI